MEESLDLSFDKLLMMMMMIMSSKWSHSFRCFDNIFYETFFFRYSTRIIKMFRLNVRYLNYKLYLEFVP